MNGVHDLGGVQGFGPVRPEPESEEPVFHEEWEGRVYAMVRLIGGLGLWNLDMVRRTRENLRPADYLAFSYYEIWFAALQKQLVESGLVSEEELRTGRASSVVSGPILERVMRAERVRAMPFMTTSYRRPGPAPAQFVPGDRVRPVTATRADTPASRATFGATSGRWTSTMGPRCFRTSARRGWSRGAISTACASMRASCGASRRTSTVPCTSTSGRNT